MLQLPLKRVFLGILLPCPWQQPASVPPPLPSLGTAGPCNFHQYLLGAPRVKTSETLALTFCVLNHLVFLPSALHFSVLFDFLIMYTQCTPISLSVSSESVTKRWRHDVFQPPNHCVIPAGGGGGGECSNNSEWLSPSFRDFLKSHTGCPSKSPPKGVYEKSCTKWWNAGGN